MRPFWFEQPTKKNQLARDFLITSKWFLQPVTPLKRGKKGGNETGKNVATKKRSILPLLCHYLAFN